HRPSAEDAATEATNGRVRTKLGRIPLEGSGATQRSTIELGVEGLQSTISRERQAGACVVLRRQAERRAEAALARVGNRSQQTLARVLHSLAAVRNKETRIDRLRYREAELNLATGPDCRAQVGQLEPGPAVIG